jgi:Protein of unknown function (DUF4236)
MGFGFRKSFGSGPFRVTVSPSGVSTSFGVRGARVTAGPRGTFVTVSSHGVYYRHRLDKPFPDAGQSNMPGGPVESPSLDSVFQVPVAELIDTNQNHLVARLNKNVSATNPAIAAALASGIGVFLIPSSPTIAGLFISIGLAATIWLHLRFKKAHTDEIHYSLDQTAATSFEAKQRALAALSSCSRIWALNTKSAIHDLKRNAGASTLITRKPASIGALPTKGFKPSIAVTSMSANNTVLHFLPDQILIFSSGRYTSADYDQLSLDAVPTRYIETEGVPSDSLRVDTTWRFVNKNRGPDRRFSNNSQLPILQYGQVTFRTATGLQVVLQTSSFDKASAFVSGFRNSERLQEPSSGRDDRNASAASPAGPSSLLDCYGLLGITRPCTLEQASSAHCHQALLYHPDKYEHLAPEMKDIASARMQTINEAYLRVKLDISSS